MIKIYDSVADIRAEGLRLDAFGGMKHKNGYESDISWFGGESAADTKRKSLVGDTSLVSEAEELLSQLSTEIETPRRIWDRSPAGAFAVVPDVLAGLPTPMRRLREIGDERASITLLAISTSSAGINAATLLRRGVVILALTMALSRTRPVSLWTVSILDGARGDGDETVLSTRINTAPLDTATACYVLSSAGFDRRLTHGISDKINGYRGDWPKRFSYSNPAPYYAYLAQTLSLDPKRTLVIGAAQLGDELLTQPTQWIRNQIAKFDHVQELMEEVQ